MEMFRQTVLSFIGGAMVCGVLLAIVPKGWLEGLMKLLCGLFLTVSLLNPLADLSINKWLSDWTLTESDNGEAAAALGQDFSRDLLALRIKQETEEYILDKAAALNADLCVEVTLSDSDIPIPVTVTLSGNISSHSQKQMEQIIQEDLNISKENQLWTEENSGKK